MRFFKILAGGYVVTDIYQETVQQSIDESKKTVKKYRDLFREKDVSTKIFTRKQQIFRNCIIGKFVKFVL